MYKEIMSRGFQKGREEGREEELRTVLLRQLNRRFFGLDELTRKQVETLPFAKAEELTEAIFDFETITDLRN